MSSWECPRCNRFTFDFPAISRRDNKTKICSGCGADEAIFDFRMSEAERKGAPKHLITVRKVQEKSWMEGD